MNPLKLTPAKLAIAAGVFLHPGPSARADYATEILADSPLAYWRFSDGVVTDDLDSVLNTGSAAAAGNGLGSGTYTRGVAGAVAGNTAIRFSQAAPADIAYTGGFAVENHPAFNPSHTGPNPFTVECWVLPANNTSTLLSPLGSMSFATGRAGWLIYQNAATWQLRIGDKASTSPSVLNGGTVTPGVWQHLAATYTGGTSGTMELFVNGVSVGSAAVASYEANDNAPLTIGSTAAPNRTFNGTIDEVAFHQTLLTPGRIAARVAEATANPSGYAAHVLADSPVGYWRLDEPVFVPRTPPVAANAGTLGATANGAYFAGSKNSATGPSAANGFAGMGASNSALSLATANGYVGTTQQLLNNRSAFTVTGWVKRGAVKSTRGGYFGQNDLLEFGDADNATNIEAWVNARGGNIKAPFSFPDDTWGFIALTASATDAKLFLDGVEVGAMTGALAGYGSSAFNFNIGGGGVFGPGGDFFRGEIDEVAVFDKPLSALRVRQLYQAAKGNVAPAEVTLSVSPDATVAQGQPYTLTADHDGSPTFTYRWFVDGVEIPSSNTRTLTIPAAPLRTPAGPWSYTVEIKNAQGTLVSPVPLQVTVTPGIEWTGTAAGNPTAWDLGTTANWRIVGTATPSVFTDGVAALFNDTATGTTVNVAGTVLPQSMTFANPAKDFTVGGTGTVGGSGGLAKSGAGALTFTAAGTFTGPVTQSGGTLTFGNGSAASLSDTSPVNVTGGTFRHHAPAGGFFLNPVTLAAGSRLEITGTGDLSMEGADGITGGDEVVFARDGAVTVGRPNLVSTIRITAGSVSFDGNQAANRAANNAAITVGTGAAAFVRGVNALPTWANSVNFTVNGGTLGVVSGGSTAIPGGNSHAHLGNVTLNGGELLLSFSGEGSAYNEETFQLNGDISVIGTAPSVITAISGTDEGNSGIATAVVRALDVADVTASPAPDLTLRAELEAADSGTSGINKAGAGTLLLAGGLIHSMPGTFTVSGGTLLGTGSLTGPLVVNAGGTVSPGDGVGSFSTGDFTLAGTAVFDINGATSDQMTVLGNITASPGAVIAINATTPSASSYVLATWSGALTGPVPNVTGIPAGYAVDLMTPGQLRLVTASSPFAAWAAAAGLTAGNNGPADDPDNDGSANVLEFALGGNPLSATDRGGVVGRVESVGGSPAHTFTILARSGAVFAAAGTAQSAAVDGITCRVEATADLQAWTVPVTPVTPALDAGLPPAPTGYAWFTFRTPGPVSSAAKEYFRVKVTMP